MVERTVGVVGFGASRDDSLQLNLISEKRLYPILSKTVVPNFGGVNIISKRLRGNITDMKESCGRVLLVLEPLYYMGGCQNYGPFLGPYYSTAPII